MPFDDRELPGQTGALPSALIQHRRRFLSLWLFGLCAMMLVMIVLGGATRLTGSGLSIMEWAPLSGIVPPLSQHEWERLFALYQQIPQYRLLHEGFGLDGFRQIFWLEWAHRLWGRLLGLALAGPLLVFALLGWLNRALLIRLALLFMLGGLQGVVGWVMVSSGFFADSTAVSVYRLVAHLVLALSLYAAVLWTALTLRSPGRQAGASSSSAALVRALSVICAVLVALTIVAGGFTAGLHAGLVYNEFPWMGGGIVPPDYAYLEPFARNLFENPPAVQFDHRLLATITALATTTLVAAAWLSSAAGMVRARGAVLALGGTVALQYALGVVTLLRVVPVWLAVLHQGTAVLVLTGIIATLHALRPARWRDTSITLKQGQMA